MISLRFSCPVCGANQNQAGTPLRSEWAVANHIAGKIHTWSDHNKHRWWARRHAPNADLHKTGFALARDLEDAVYDALTQKTNIPLPASRPASNLESVQEIEVLLHAYIERRLRTTIGEDQEQWWVDGVPLPIRKNCAQLREEDPDRTDLFSYTYLIDLKAILEKNWPLFEPDFSALKGALNSKKETQDQLTKLNRVRNRYAHAVRAPEVGNKQYKEDQEFLCALLAAIHELVR